MRRLKAEYLQKLAEVKLQQHGAPAAVNVTVNSLPTKHQGRPLLLGKVLDTAVQDYVKAQREACAPINTSIVMAAAEGIIAARDPGLLVHHGWAH